MVFLQLPFKEGEQRMRQSGGLINFPDSNTKIQIRFRERGQKSYQSML